MSDTPVRHRNYRIMRISSLGDPDAAEVLYRNDPSLRCCSFAEQRRSWLAEKIHHGDALARAMKSMGHEAEEIICDMENLQRTWAWERGIEVDEKNWRTQLVLHQIAESKPEVLFLQDHDVLPYESRRDLKARFPFIELVVIHQQSIVPSPKVIRELSTADLLLVSSAPLYRRCREVGLSPHLVYSCFDPGILSQLPAPSKVAEAQLFDFTYVMESGPAANNRNRNAQLKGLMHQTPLEIWSSPQSAPLPVSNSTKSHGPVYGLDYYKVLQRSRITFNAHGDLARGGVGNQKLFQATGVGACTITDRGANLGELFKDGTEVLTYDCVEDCVEKVDYLLNHEDERREIAAAGRMRTLSEHSSRKRYSEVDEIIQRALAGRRRSLRSRWSGLSGSLSF